MKYLFFLSKEDIELAKKEIFVLLDSYGVFYDYFVDYNLLIVDMAQDLKLINILANRLAYTKAIYRYLNFFTNDGIEFSNSSMISKFLLSFETPDFVKEGFFDFENYVRYKFRKIEILPYYKNNFCFRKSSLVSNSKFTLSEKEFSDKVYERLNLEMNVSGRDEKIVVKLKNSETNFELFILKDISYFCVLIKKIEQNFNSRNTKYLPAKIPISLKPKLSRVMVNLTGVVDGVLYDPFCGIGGFLIEGGLVGLKIVGSDISFEMVESTKINLDYFSLSAIELFVKDALEANYKCEGIVCDLPYGKNTKKVENLERLSLDFLKNIYDYTNCLVIGSPDFLKLEKLIEKTKWKIDFSFDYYLHKNLSKNIFRLVK